MHRAIAKFLTVYRVCYSPSETLISPTMVKGKRIYRDACDETNSWNTEVSPTLAKDWNKWMKQLQDVKIPRSVIRENTTVEGVDIHQFADASSLACSTAAVAVINQGTMNVKGLLASKSRISKQNTSIARLELISGHMAANLSKNLCQALPKEWPVKSVTIWIDSMVALYWISNPGKSWKIFRELKRLLRYQEKLASNGNTALLR